MKKLLVTGILLGSIAAPLLSMEPARRAATRLPWKPAARKNIRLPWKPARKAPVRKMAGLTPSPEKLLEEIKMLGIKMVYQPRPFKSENIRNANALLDQAARIIAMIEQIGSAQQIAEAKKALIGMLNMYKVHLQAKPRKRRPGEPPLLLAPRPATKR